MEELIIHYIADAVLMALSGISGWAFRSYKNSQAHDLLIEEAVCSLIRSKLLEKMEMCLHGGYCSKEMRDNINHMYSIYIRLGGNGTIPPLREKVMELPLDLEVKK